jgi:hypothetical protein
MGSTSGSSANTAFLPVVRRSSDADTLHGHEGGSNGEVDDRGGESRDGSGGEDEGDDASGSETDRGAGGEKLGKRKARRRRKVLLGLPAPRESEDAVLGRWLRVERIRVVKSVILIVKVSARIW